MTCASSLAATTADPCLESPTPAVRGWARFAPTLADAVFLLVLVQVLHLGATALFNDPGTGWHIRIGQEVLRTDAPPTVETFSWTRNGRPFVATQFEGDLILAAAWEWGGYPCIALLCAMCLAALFRWMYRTVVADGAWPIWGLIATMLAVSAASSQFLARPLLMTLVGIPVCLSLSRRFVAGDLNCGRLALLPILALIWVKFHPGVLGGVVTVALVGIGGIVDAILSKDDRERRLDVAGRGLLALLVAALMAAATWTNPYHFEWHRWIIGLMQMRSLPSLVDEWQPTDWTQADAVAALILLGLLVLAHVLRREKPSAVTVLVTGFWLFQAVCSGRHLSLLGLVLALQAAPMLKDARRLEGSIGGWARRLPLFSASIRSRERQRREGLAALAALGAFALLGMEPTGAWLGLAEAGPPADRYSPGLTAYLRGHAVPEPIFNDINFGGQLILEAPHLPVYVDDRFEVYGDEFIREYAEAMVHPEHHAAVLLDANGVQTAIVGAHAPITRWLKLQGEWKLAWSDATALVFIRDSAAHGAPCP